MTFEEVEKTKYQRVWEEIPEYGNNPPAVALMPMLLRIFESNNIKTVLDAGCGCGKGLKMLLDKGYESKGIDITLDGLSDESLKEYCLESHLWDISFKKPFDAVISIDVMEHIPTPMIFMTLAELSRLCKKFAIFQIALFKDGFGKRINDTLHLSLLTVGEWDKTLNEHFDYVRIVEQSTGYVIFFCSNKED